MKKLSLVTQILIALILAIIVGLILGAERASFASQYIKPFGTIFLNLIKFIVVPVVLFSMICGIVSMKDIKKVGKIGIRTLIYYLCTTAIAIVIGLVIASLFKRFFPIIATTGLSYQAKSSSFMNTIIDIFPSNIVAPFLNASMLQIIVAALLIGFAVILIDEKKTKPAVDFFNSLNEVSMKIMELILKLSPLGVFCLLCPVVAANGAQILGSLAMVLLTAYICYILHMVIVYSISVKTMGGMSPKQFFKGMLPAMIFAFSSASSVGTLPINMKCCDELGVDKEVSSFVLPLGATVNMDGTAIYQGVCAVFIAACYGINLTLGQMVTIVLTATLASIGTAGVPGAGMIMLAMVLSAVGLPIDGIAIVAGVDRIFDMGRTTVNITGDAACAVCVSRSITKKK